MKKGNVKIEKSRLSFFLLFLPYFHFIFDLFSFLELRVRVKPMNTRRKT